MKAHLIALAMLATPAAARAQEIPTATTAPTDVPTLSADRPGFSTPTGIVPVGHIQLESGISASRSGSARGASFGELLVRVPVAPRAEVRLGVPSYLVGRDSGVRATGADDLFAETKILLSAGERTNYALLLNAVLPTGSRRVAEHRFQPGATLAADVTLCEKVGVTLNLGTVHASDGGDRYTQIFEISSFNFTLTPKTGAFAELYASNQATGPTQKYLDGGFTYLLNPKTQIDASAGVGLGNDVGGPDYFYGVGLSKLF